MTNTSPRILVADDQPDVLQAARLLLSDSGFVPDLVPSVEAAISQMRDRQYDLALVDLNYTRDTTSGREGLELVSRLLEIDPLIPIVVMTGWGSIDIAVDAMRRGARSFVQKPWEDRTLLEIIQREINEARARRDRDGLMQREADEAQSIQRRLLPVRFPEIGRLHIGAAWRPAGGVGGDCFDLLPFEDNQVAIAVSDVAGKGMAAAILMSNMQAAVRAFAERETRPRTLATSVNRLLCRNVLSGRFVSFFYVHLDVDRRRLLYCNAGHNPPILLRSNGTVERLTTGGMVLGVIPEATYEEAESAFTPGDRVVVYTDGVTEACNGRNEEYGEQRLIDAASRFVGHDANALQEYVFDDVLNFTGGELQDDATLVVAILE